MKNTLIILVIITMFGCSKDIEEPVPVPVPIATAATSITSNGFTANWNNFNGAEGYEIEVATNASFSMILIAQSINVNSWNISGLEPVTEYFYRVRAVYGGNNKSDYSNAISLITLPMPPKALAATNETSDGFTANWQEVTGISSFLLYLSEDNFASDPPTYVMGYGGKEVSGISHDVTGLEPGRIYFFALKSKLDGALSNFSNSIFVETTN